MFDEHLQSSIVGYRWALDFRHLRVLPALAVAVAGGAVTGPGPAGRHNSGANREQLIGRSERRRADPGIAMWRFARASRVWSQPGLAAAPARPGSGWRLPLRVPLCRPLPRPPK